MWRTTLLTLVLVGSMSGFQLAAGQLAGLPERTSPDATPRPLVPAPADAPTELLARFAGRYQRGDGFTGDTVELRKDGHFEWTDWGCTYSYLYSGKVKSDGGDLLLVADWMTDQRAADGQTATDGAFGPVVPVPWGERRYLIERDRLRDFCEAFNAGSEPAVGFGAAFMLRDGDIELAVEGLPEVPAAWRDELLHPGVWGRITATEPDGTAVVDLGSDDGIRAGMGLGLQFERNSDWAVARRSSWYFSTRLLVAEVRPDSCVVRRSNGDAPLKVGQLVTGGIAAELPLPLATWRSVADDSRLSFEPLPPLAGTTPDELADWTERIRATFSPGVAIGQRIAPELVDSLTPAFFNAVRGLNMANETDIRRASTILEVWLGYESQCEPPRQIALEFDGEPGWDARAGTLDRIWQVETFVMWWREMSADPARLADFQRGRSR